MKPPVVMRDSSLEFHLHAELDDALGRDLEERIGAHGVAGNEHEQPFSPQRQAGTAGRQQRLDAEEERRLVQVDGKTANRGLPKRVRNVRFRR